MSDLRKSLEEGYYVVAYLAKPCTLFYVCAFYFDFKLSNPVDSVAQLEFILMDTSYLKVVADICVQAGK